MLGRVNVKNFFVIVLELNFCFLLKCIFIIGCVEVMFFFIFLFYIESILFNGEFFLIIMNSLLFLFIILVKVVIIEYELVKFIFGLVFLL